MSDFRLEYLQYDNERKLHARKMEMLDRIEKAMLEQIREPQAGGDAGAVVAGNVSPVDDSGKLTAPPADANSNKEGGG